MSNAKKFGITIIILSVIWGFYRFAQAENTYIWKNSSSQPIINQVSEISPNVGVSPTETRRSQLAHILKLIKTKKPQYYPVVLEILKHTGDFPYTDYLIRLAWCESRFNSHARRPNGRFGLDRGIFQINDYYHPEVSDKCAYDIECSTRWTINMILQGRQHEWTCSSKIKGKTLEYLLNKYK